MVKKWIVVMALLSSSLSFASELIKLDPDFANEQKINGTTYLNKEEREQYLIQVKKNGLILDQKGTPLDTRNLPNGTAMFVHDKNGNIYISTTRSPLKFDHSSLVAGEDIICAGNMKVNRGQLDFINDASAMYDTKKSEAPLMATIKKLRILEVDLKKMRVFFQKNF